MSEYWTDDIHDMHLQYGFHPKVDALDADGLRSLLEFRINFLREELTELETAESADDVVDALIDLCVVAIGTLDLFGVDSNVAWDRVHVANTSKRVGIKESRPNPAGFPDLVKPEGWQAPTHEDNVGLLAEIFK